MHQAEPVTIAKLRWLLGKATATLGQETRCYLRDPDGHLIEVGQSNQTDRSAD